MDGFLLLLSALAVPAGWDGVYLTELIGFEKGSVSMMSEDADGVPA